MEEYESIGKSVAIIHKYFKLYLKNALKDFDINVSEAMVLLMLCGQECGEANLYNSIHSHGHTQEWLVGELSYDKSVIARTVQSLEAKGYVRKNDNPDDNRSFILTATDKASDIMLKITGAIKEWNNILLRDVENLDIVCATMKTMTKNIEIEMKDRLW